MDEKNLLEQNTILQKQILKLQAEIFELQQNNDLNIFKNKIYNLIDKLENNDINDINKDTYLYIHNIKIDIENKLKDNIILQKCNYLLNEIETNDINNNDFINKLKSILL
jgi:hypothetical protein